MLVPQKAMEMFKQGLYPSDVVAAGVKVLANTHVVSDRRADEWFKAYKDGYAESYSTKMYGEEEELQEITPEDITVEELDLLRNMLRVGAEDNFEAMRYSPDQFPETEVVYNEYDPEERIAKLREAMRLIREVQDQDDPIYTNFVKDFKTDRPVAVMFPSCMHMGGRYTDDEFIEQQLDSFSDYGYFFDLGDEIDGFTPAWFHAGSIVEQPLQVPYQIALFDAYMDRFWNKIIGGMWSQHGSMWFEKNQGYTPLKRRFLERGIPFFDGRANLTFKVGDQVYSVVASHEFVGTSQWNQTHALIKALKMEYPNADVVVQGDKHTYKVDELVAYPEEYEAKRRQSPFVWLIQTGTAKTGPDKYTIKRWSKGQSIWPITVFYPDRHLVKVTRHIEDAIRWLED